jgi:hypothetical protein
MNVDDSKLIGVVEKEVDIQKEISIACKFGQKRLITTNAKLCTLVRKTNYFEIRAWGTTTKNREKLS